jgi:hypothetical protein
VELVCCILWPVVDVDVDLDLPSVIRTTPSVSAACCANEFAFTPNVNRTAAVNSPFDFVKLIAVSLSSPTGFIPRQKSF